MGRLAKGLLVFVGIIVFLCAMPSVIDGGVGRSVQSIRSEEAKGKFTGTLKLWHVVAFKTGGTSGVSYLKQRVSDFEKRNPYVFIDVMGMTPDEARERLKKGENPDIISFPLGFVQEASALLPLEPAENLLTAFQNCGTQEGETYAYPYMADSYSLICNQDIFSMKSVPLPMEDRFCKENFFLALKELSYDSDGHVSPLTLSATVYPKIALLFPDMVEYDESLMLDVENIPTESPLSNFEITVDGKDAFISGKAAMYLAPSSEYYHIGQTPSASSLSISEYSISMYTDLVQMVGVTVSEDEKKNKMSSEFCKTLLRTKSQRALEDMGMMSVIPLTDIYEGKLLESYQKIGTRGIIPNTFILSGESKNLPALIDSAMRGETSTLLELLVTKDRD